MGVAVKIAFLDNQGVRIFERNNNVYAEGEVAYHFNFNQNLLMSDFLKRVKSLTEYTSDMIWGATVETYPNKVVGIIDRITLKHGKQLKYIDKQLRHNNAYALLLYSQRWTKDDVLNMKTSINELNSFRNDIYQYNPTKILIEIN